MAGFRFMRMIVFFDLPAITVEEKRRIIGSFVSVNKNGFVMLQESYIAK